MEIQIALNSSSKSLEEVKAALESEPHIAASGAQLELRAPKKKFRGIDPTLLVAIVGAAGTGLGAIITGLFQISQQIAAKKFTLETASGAKLEVPANTPPDQIDRLLEKLGQNDVKKISVE
jgi:hypothetical protein